jgi:hypothetical protein
MDERRVDRMDVLHALSEFLRNPSRDEFKPEHNSWSYRIDGTWPDGHKGYLSFALPDPFVLVVTVVRKGR